MTDDILPMYNESDATADLGVSITSMHIIEEFSWVFREQPKNDLGIDAQIEIVTNNRSKGRLLAAQIKTGKSFFKYEEKSGYVYYGELKHLNYWLNSSLPVILILCNPTDKTCYWVQVSGNNITKTSKSWKILVPKNQTLTKYWESNLKQISNIPQHQDIVELSLYKFLNDKYTNSSEFGKIDICAQIDMPRDIMYIDMLAEFKNNENFTLITYHYDVYEKFSEEILLKFIEYRKINKSCIGGDPDLFVFVISEKEENLNLNKTITDIIKEDDKLFVFRLIYSHSELIGNDNFYNLTELDENNVKMDYYYFYN